MQTNHKTLAICWMWTKRVSRTCMMIVLLVGCGDGSVSSEPEAPRDAQWREDITYLIDRMHDMHPDLYHTVEQSVFEEAGRRLLSEISLLTDDQLFVELLRLVALPATERDGHTAISFFEGTGFKIVPVQFFRFMDGVFVVDASPTMAHLVGKKLVGIGDFTLEEVNHLIDPLIPRDNEHSLIGFRNLVYITPAILKVLGIVADADTPRYQFEDESEFLPAVLPGQYGLESIYNLPTPSNPPLYLRRRNENFWLQHLQADGILYLRLNAVQPTSGSEDLAAFGERALSIIDSGGIDRVIIDLRQNSGGNNQLIAGILDFLSDPRINQDDRLLVFTDRNTFSAAGNLVAAIDAATKAQFVGVSPGGSGSQFGDVERVDLPNSRIAVFIPTRHWIFGDTAFQPLMQPMDEIVEPTARAFLAGEDPLLDRYTGN